MDADIAIAGLGIADNDRQGINWVLANERRLRMDGNIVFRIVAYGLADKI